MGRVQALEARVSELSESDISLAWDVVRLRSMLWHRAITAADLVVETGRSLTFVNNTISGRFNTSPDRARRNVDEIEDAVTSITDKRGGIPIACCSPLAQARTIGVLRRAEYGG